MKHGLFSDGLIFLAVCATVCCAQNKNEKTSTPAQSIVELRQQLEKILAGTHTPGLSVAIAHKDGVEWVAGLGQSDVATNQATTDDTLFRVGSVSKSFVALSILKLVNERKLSLHDTVRALAPEIWFENRWEATDPVRVVDLLEHTTGWDDIPLQFAKDVKVMSLRDGLDYYRTSRVSRWRPGTRMSYCNTGPAVAAYIVEKVTGRPFEDYVTQNFFVPIGMKTATYFEQPTPQLTTLYDRDGKTPSSYWNLLLRPAGSINASARDMAAYVQFYLNRGAVGRIQVMPAASVERMEIPTRTWEAQEGLKAGYGLGNFVSVHDGFVYHGHTGGVNGGRGLTEMSYMPADGVGYFYSINSDNNAAFGQIGDVIRAYLTRGLPRALVPAAIPLPTNAQEYAGWYVPVAPRYEMTHFLFNLAMVRVRFGGDNLLLTDPGQIDRRFVPVSGAQFRYVPKKDHAEPIATVALLTPNADGRFLFLGEPRVGLVKRVPAGLAMAQIALTGWFVLAIVGILLYAPCWIIGGLIKRKRRRPAERAIRLWPLIAVVGLFASLAILGLAGSDPFARPGPTVWSFGLFLATLSFGLASVASAVALWVARKREIRRFVRWHSMVVTSALLVAVVYLAYWGVIGIRI